RAVSLTPHQLLIREMILQLKTGKLDTSYFRQKFGVAVWDEFSSIYNELRDKALLKRSGDKILLTRQGLLEVDRFLLEFFEPELRTVRYA
ncbi:MAG TPA: hypothetical protein VIR01_11270, partial [Pyrinomonadaceae bacterium]